MRASILLGLAAFAASSMASLAPEAPAAPAAPAYPPVDDASPPAPYPPADDASPPAPYPSDGASPITPGEDCDVVYVTTTVVCTETGPATTVYADKPLDTNAVKDWAGYPPKDASPAPPAPAPPVYQPAPPAPAPSYPAEDTSPPSPPAHGDYPNDAPTDYGKKALAAHNECRAKHGTKPLKWSTKLANDAQNWANGCRGMVHQPGTGQGENLYATTESKGADPYTGIVESWYAEEPKYSYGEHGSMQKAWGHFTQIVWDGTDEVGCATKHCGSGTGVLGGRGGYLLVCRYSGPGNYPNQYRANVPPRRS